MGVVTIKNQKTWNMELGISHISMGEQSYCIIGRRGHCPDTMVGVLGKKSIVTDREEFVRQSI